MASFYGFEPKSRLFLGTAQYPSPAILAEAVNASGVEIVTVSLRREAGEGGAGQAFWSLIRDLGVRVLPNTAGCHGVKEAVTTAQMAREVFGTNWIKLEVIGEDDTLQPDVVGLIEAARILTERWLRGLPLHHRGSCRRRAPARCRLRGADALGRAHRLRPRPEQCLRPAQHARAFPGTSHWWSMPASACPPTPPRRWSWGMTRSCSTRRWPRRAILCRMAQAFARAIEAGHQAFQAQPIEARDMAAPSTPVMGKAFLS